MINARTKTGIVGLDELLEGGFPTGRSILVSGGCGTGKTIFSLQYLYNGIQKYQEPGIFVTLDERPELIREDMLRFNWDLRELEQKNMLQIIDGSIAKVAIPSEETYSLPATGFDLDKLLLEIMRLSKRTNAKRIVIDSIPALGFNYENENDIRKAVLKLSYVLSKTGLTCLMTSEMDETGTKFGKYGVEEYVVDGVIVLHYMGVGTQTNRTLHIRKMRATHHSEDLHPLRIGQNGITVHSIDEDYEET